MKKNRSKQKGSAFERSIAKKLSLWLSNNQNDDLLWRSAMSGGRATVQLSKGTVNRLQAGDISNVSTDHKLAHRLIDTFIIECKHYKDLKLHSFIYNTPTTDCILDFWTKLYSKDAVKYSKEPMLIAKQNFHNTLIVLKNKSKFVNLLADRGYYPLAVFTRHRAVVYDFADLVNTIDAAMLELL